ncbi:MAG: HAD family hydrolase [Candidatus Liptonbacteria bacterium]|nr:HAD family hydrolase [Candidatus Liptonbacteria bacterium]
MNKAVFFDRDGVILELPKGNEAYGFIYKKEDVVIVDGVREALHALKGRGYLNVIITNQPVIARGIVSYEDVVELHEFINRKLGGLIDRFYFCPHHPETHPDVPERALKYRTVCGCRKPAPGMIIKAAKDLNINLKKSWMLGDMVTDIAAGEAAGCKTIMIESLANSRVPKSGNAFKNDVKPTSKAQNALDAVRYILEK